MRNIFLVSLYLFVITSVCSASTLTTNYSLSKPAEGDTDWAGEVNTNFDTIDGQMKSNEDDIDTNDTATALNTTHRGSDGSDHSDVVTNSAKTTNATHGGDRSG